MKSKKRNQKQFYALLLLFITSIIFISCSSSEDKNTELSDNFNLRKEFIKNKNFDEVKITFDELETKEKYALWNDKINQLLTQKLPQEHLEILKELKKELINLADDKPNKVPELAIKLAKITPKEDFIQMYSTLEDYNYTGHFEGSEKISNEIINTFKRVISNRTMEADKFISATSRQKKCNCSWTCDSTVGGYTTNCEETTSGCGFLYMFPCTGRVFDLAVPAPLPPAPRWFPKDSLDIKQ